MPSNSDQRRYSRSTIRARAELRLHTGIVMEGESRDVSMNGLFVKADHMFPVGNVCQVVLVLEGGDREFRIETSGEVVRVSEEGIAIEFEQIDLDSMEHLRKLVLYNADDPEQVEQEIEDSAGIHRHASL